MKRILSFFIFLSVNFAFTPSLWAQKTCSSLLNQTHRTFPTEVGHEISGSKNWIMGLRNLAFLGVLKHISPEGAKDGTVVAGMSRITPINYFRHWFRDAGLIINALLGTSRTSTFTRQIESRASELEKKLVDYAKFTAEMDSVVKEGGEGAALVEVNGTALQEKWGVPQNDSPALTAISLIKASEFAKRPGSMIRRLLTFSWLYGPRWDSPIKRRLEHIAHHWRDKSVDLWEEAFGDHFYTRMVIRKALLDGADFLSQNSSDLKAAQFYRAKAKEIEEDINARFLVEGRIIATAKDSIDFTRSFVAHKDTDIAIILGLLHGAREDQFLKWNDPAVLATLDRIVAESKAEFAINQNNDIPGIAIYRYLGDAFNGTATRGQGNPWVLSTIGMAEAYIKVAIAFRQDAQKFTAGSVQQLALIKRSVQYEEDAFRLFISRVRYHIQKSLGKFNEQIHRDSGDMVSAGELTWNFAAILTFLQTYEKLRYLSMSAP